MKYPRFRTKGGVLVEERWRKQTVHGERVLAFRIPTGAFHGWLCADLLTPVPEDE